MLYQYFLNNRRNNYLRCVDNKGFIMKVTDTPWVNETAPTPMPKTQVFFDNAIHEKLPVGPMNDAMFFDNNTLNVGADGTPPNTMDSRLFTATEGFSDSGVTSTTGGLPIGPAVKPV
jgi:hypothetical protein